MKKLGIFTVLALAVSFQTQAKMTLSSKKNMCKASVSFSLPSLDISCDADPRSGNPSNWINPNTQCDMTFDLLQLPSIGDITAKISGQVCSALNQIKEMTYDEALNKIQEQIPDNLTDSLNLDVDLSDALGDQFKDMVNDQLANTVKSGQTAVNNAEINQKPTVEQVSDDLSVMLDRDLCFSDNGTNLVSVSCGETLAEQLVTSSMNSQDKKSLETTTLPKNCRKDEYYETRYGQHYRYSCITGSYVEKGETIYIKQGYESLTALHKAKSDSNGCFFDNLGRSICVNNGNGSINYHQGYFDATSGTIPTDCDKSGSQYICPIDRKLDYKSIPQNCSYNTEEYSCSTVEAAQTLVSDEFGCFATLNNQRACLKPIDNWSASKPVEKKDKLEDVLIPTAYTVEKDSIEVKNEVRKSQPTKATSKPIKNTRNYDGWEWDTTDESSSENTDSIWDW